MNQRRWASAGRAGLVVCLAGALLSPMIGVEAQSGGAPSKAVPRDGQHDFDFEFGKWNIHLKRMLHPLSGTAEWAEYDGTTTTRPMWDGRANISELETTNGTERVEGLSLRLYDPRAHQWSVYWASARTGQLSLPPTVGEFKDGFGEFFDQEPFNGRQILLRFQWSRITANSVHFEQAFSDDGGKTWEVNWIADQTRVKE